MGNKCFQTNDKRKEKEKRKDETISIIVSTKKYILKAESDLETTEKEILELKNKLYSTTQKDNFDSIKEEDLKRDLYDKIKKYERLLDFKRTLKNNLETIENKKMEQGVVDIIRQNNQLFDNMNDNNAETILQNQYNLLEQNKQLQENDRLFRQGNDMFINAQDKYERDAYIKKYLGIIMKKNPEN